MIITTSGGMTSECERSGGTKRCLPTRATVPLRDVTADPLRLHVGIHGHTLQLLLRSSSSIRPPRRHRREVSPTQISTLIVMNTERFC